MILYNIYIIYIMNYNIILANIIRLIHILIIIFILYVPFSDVPIYLLLHIVSCISLLFHWYLNSDICFLTFVENYLRNIPYNKTLSYQLIAPLYNISEIEFNKFIWLLTILLLLISINKLYNSKKMNNIINLLRKDKYLLFSSNNIILNNIF